MKRTFLFLALALSLEAQTTLTLNEATTVQASPTRLGVNMAQTNFYDDGQMYKHLLYMDNGGFEPWRVQEVLHCVSGTSTSCTADDIYSSVTTNFWQGATFFFSAGQSGILSCAGTIASNTAASYPSSGATYSFSSACGQAVQSGDYIVMVQTGTQPQGWDNNLSGSATYSTETSDLHSGTAGTQAVVLNTAVSGASVGLATYLDSTLVRNFILFNGTYSFTFWAKSTSGSPTMTWTIARNSSTGTPVSATQTFAPTSSWAQYTMSFTASETNTTGVGLVKISMQTAGQGIQYLDDVDLVKTSTVDSTNTTAFSDGIIASLRALKPGVLRIWDQQMGESLDTWIAPMLGRGTGDYRSGGTYPTGPGRLQGEFQGLTDLLAAAELLGSNVELAMPTAWTVTQYQNLMDFLGGSTSTTYGAKRAALGHSAPYTSTISKLYLELGNEAWNGGFQGESMDWKSDYGFLRYGQRASTVFAAMKGMASYTANASQFVMVIGCQPVASTTFCADAHNASAYHDAVAVAGYIGGNLANMGTAQQEWNADTASGWADANDSTNGVYAGYQHWMTTTSRPVQLVTYEFGPNTLQYSSGVSSTQFQTHNGAVMNAPLNVSASLERLRLFNDTMQAAFSLTQFNFSAQGVLIPIWGILNDAGGQYSAQLGAAYTARPTFLGYQIANTAISVGSMYGSTLTGGPTYTGYALNGLPAESSVPSLFAYAFKGGSNRAVLLVNTDPQNPVAFTWAGNVPTGTLTQQVLSNTNGYDDTNETSPGNVSVVSSTVAAASTYTVPAASVVAVTWGGAAPTCAITTASLASGAVGTAYSQTLAQSYCSTSNWAVSTGSLPAGLSLNVTTGAITGTPTAAGTSTFTVTYSTATSSSLGLTISSGSAPSTTTYVLTINGVPLTSNGHVLTVSH